MAYSLFSLMALIKSPRELSLNKLKLALTRSHDGEQRSTLSVHWLVKWVTDEKISKPGSQNLLLVPDTPKPSSKVVEYRI